jgi:uncharacterized protein involved in exopolysaccharide biosynthesis
MQETATTSDLLALLLARKKLLAWVIVVTTGLSSIVMLIKPNIYKAQTIFYPASISIQKPVFTEAEQNINYYGDDHDVDRMLSTANSLDLKMEMIEDFELSKHYGHDESLEKTLSIFNKSYNVLKTEFDAIRIEFYDRDPSFSAQLVNAARDRVDHKTQEIIKKAQKSVLNSAEQSLVTINEQIKELNQVLTKERLKYGIYDTESQAQAFAILESRGGQMSDIDKRTTLYTEGITNVKTLEEQILQASEMKIRYQSNVDRLKSAMESSISAIHIIENGTAPLKKYGPRRTLYVLGAVIMMIFISSLIILMVDSNKPKA